MDEPSEYQAKLQEELAEARRRADRAEADAASVRSEFSPELSQHVGELPPVDAQGLTLQPSSQELLYDVSVEGVRRWCKSLIPTIRTNYLEILNDPATSAALKFNIGKHVENMGFLVRFPDGQTDETFEKLSKLFKERAADQPTVE